MFKLQLLILTWLLLCSRFLHCLLLDISRMTTLDVEDYVQRQNKLRNGKAAIVISVGATEQHGPTGLIGTDQLTAAAVASKVCENCDVLLGPHLSVGMSIHHCQFAGSTSLRPSTFVNMICDIVWSLQQSSNITHFFFINGHGGNALPMRLAFAILRATAQNTEHNTAPWLRDCANDDCLNTACANDRSIQMRRGKKEKRREPTKCQYEFVSWYANEENQRLAKKLYGDKLGQHATPDEISMTQYLFPETRRDSSLLNSENVNRKIPGRTLRRFEGDDNDKDALKTLKSLISTVEDSKEREKLIDLGKSALTYMDPFDFEYRFRDGRMNSDPSLSCYEDGERLFATSIEAVSKSLQKFLDT